MGLELLQTLLQQASARGSRSTALQTVIWTACIFVAALVSSISISAPGWVVVFLGCSVALLLITFVFAYAYFAVKNPDALRSERFTLTPRKSESPRAVAGSRARSRLTKGADCNNIPRGYRENRLGSLRTL